MIDVYVVVGVIAYHGDTTFGVRTDYDAALKLASDLAREHGTRVYDDGFDVRGPFPLDGPAVAPT